MCVYVTLRIFVQQCDNILIFYKNIIKFHNISSSTACDYNDISLTFSSNNYFKNEFIKS